MLVLITIVPKSGIVMFIDNIDGFPAADPSPSPCSKEFYFSDDLWQ